MTFKAGLVQMCSGTDEAANLKVATELIRNAADQGADFISTPEITNLFEPDRVAMAAKISPESESIAVKIFAELAAELETWLHIGSLALKAPSGKALNRTLLFNPKGEIAAAYNKIHLYDVDLPNGDKYRESDFYLGGVEAVTLQTPFAHFGLTICYDVRFPLLHHALSNAGANVLLGPAAFTVPTGFAHWHVLHRARAVETGSFVIAAAQGGDHANGRSTYGHSLVVNPWGEVIGELAHDRLGVLLCDIDISQSRSARVRIPTLTNAKPFSLTNL